MAIKILMPSLSPTMLEGKISKWVKKEGDKIKSGDIIAEIETDKAMIDFESTEEGILGKIVVADGTEGVKVNELIAVMLEEGEDKAAIDAILSSSAPASSSTEAGTPEVKNADNANAEGNNKPESKASSDTTKAASNTTAATKDHGLEQPLTTVNALNNNNTNARIIATPLAKNIAKLNSIDISKVKGTGPNGRIIKADIENAIKNPSVLNTGSTGSKYSKGNSGQYTDKPNSGIRKIIAKRLLESKTQIPHYYETIEVEMDALLALRSELNIKGKDKYKLSVNDFIIKAVALCMQDVPEANCYWNGETTRYFKSSDVSIAVAVPAGLITPIVKEAEAKSIVEISLEMKDLVLKAKEGRLKPSEYQGGGFSISNLGMFGIDEFNAIINPPQAGILAVGATKQMVVVKNNQMVIANVMRVTISADHRVMDGAIAAQFLNVFKKYMELPALMFYLG